MMVYPKCPECNSTKISVLCTVWLDFTDNEPVLDSKDAEYAEPTESKDNAFCRHCNHVYYMESDK